MSSIISLHNIEYSYDSDFTLSVQNLEIAAGESVCILGLNGSGKTTLLHVLARVLMCKKGTVCFGGVDTATMQYADIAQHRALVEQEVHYVFPYTVLEAVLMGRFAHHGGRFFESDEDLAKAEDAMQATDVARYHDRVIFGLSGGERRRVEIARALCQETEVLLLDEPTAFLDIKQKRTFVDILKKIHAEGRTVITVTHSLELARELGSRIVVMDRGIIARDLPCGSDLSEDAILEIVS